MVLRFDSFSYCAKFLNSLELLLYRNKKTVNLSHTDTARLLSTAETIEIRKQKLEQFFREAYAKAFGMPDTYSDSDEMKKCSSEAVLRTTLTRAEFANALGMDEEDLLIQRLFSCVARSNPEKICFQDFLNTVIKFAKGSVKEKLEIFFAMCDRSSSGQVDREEFCSFMRSIVTSADFNVMSEHRDLRRVMGLGISFSRGSAAGISLCMGVILLTVCRNVITKIRETPIGQYIPFDSAITFHKIVGITAGIFSAIHSAGHCINFYHISTQDIECLQCLFQEAFFSANLYFSSDVKPSVSYWLYGTVTGVTGILLVAVMAILYVFSVPSVLNNAYHAFRVTHTLNIAVYALTIIHGLPKLVSPPSFGFYILAPVIILFMDRLMGMRHDYKNLEILSAKTLSSNVTYIKLKRPKNFNFRSGQWVRLRCPAFNHKMNEWHAFSLASTPRDRVLKIFVKALGPWTWKLRNGIQQAQKFGLPYPTVFCFCLMIVSLQFMRQKH
ncbi:unnamed protein product [Soboliphyme baturini]|uniref:EF-hand domain-containing protein n=1 Tax=Soboliphyme baturini TaxID=241478 RepID=A0A183J065_9BILA|nr:unnamed protein product [Soboliphyme baturini]